MPDTPTSNPYDFGSPVKSENKFADRSEEQDKIREYMNLSRSEDPSYYHLALTGSRAAGKTSLLNRTAEIATDLGFLPVKISLNEGLVNTDAAFFTEVLDAIMIEGTAKGMYGGRKNEIYKRFRELVDTVNLEVEVPLGFGTAYVGSKQQDGMDSIPQRVLSEDLQELRSEAADHGMPTIVLLFDECDLLAKNKSILQKIRNIFTEISGYILVFSGTKKMFPDLSETFSPLPRSFITVNVDNFEDVENTEECITKPLPDEEKDLISRQTIYEVHRLTRGSPYEINLVCHHMYRRFKKEESEIIELSKGVLDDVLSEITRLRVEEHHEIADSINSLSIEKLELLTSTLEFRDSPREAFLNYAVLDRIEDIFEANIQHVLQNLENDLADLIEMNIVVEDEDGIISFNGDQFDSLYLRYFVASMDEARGSVEFFQGNTDDYVSNIERKLNRHIVLKEYGDVKHQTIVDSPSRVVFEKTDESIPIEYYVSLSLIDPEYDTVLPALSAKVDIIDTYMVDGPFSQSDVVTYRCNVPWLQGGFTTAIPANELSQKQLRERLKRIARILPDDIYKFDFDTDVEHVSEAKNDIEESSFNSAIDHLEEAIEINNRNNVAKLYLAEALQKRGDVDSALEVVEDLIESYPSWKSAKIRRELIRISRGDEIEGTQRITDLLTSGEADTDTYSLVISEVDSLGASEIADDFVSLLYGSELDEVQVGVALVESGRIDSGEAVLEGIDYSDDDTLEARVKYNLACVYSMKNLINDSLTMLEEAIHIHEQYAESAKDDPDLDNIKNTDDFERIVVN